MKLTQTILGLYEHYKVALLSAHVVDKQQALDIALKNYLEDESLRKRFLFKFTGEAASSPILQKERMLDSLEKIEERQKAEEEKKWLDWAKPQCNLSEKELEKIKTDAKSDGYWWQPRKELPDPYSQLLYNQAYIIGEALKEREEFYRGA